MKIGTISDTKEYLFWIWLSQKIGAGSALYPDLLEKFGSPYDLYKADEEEISATMPSLNAHMRAQLADKSLDGAYEILEYCKRNGYGILCFSDPRYPLSYRSIYNPPLLLYYKGILPDFQTRLHIAMVGTRKMSEYGRKTAYKIAYELASAGAVIVSGMALGVDSVSSCAALAAGGQTVAILGCGIDVSYPSEHAGFKHILEQQAVVMTEFAPGTRPIGKNFPIRNRLISGLCQGTLVVEAGEGSGALITAEQALAQGRDLFALPGNIGDANTGGTNQLIRNGARVALCADDILEQYSALYQNVLKVSVSASLGKRSDYDGAQLVRMGVYSRTADGHTRVRADDLSEGIPSMTTMAKAHAAEAENVRAPSIPTQAVPSMTYAENKQQSAAGTIRTAEKKLQPCPADHSAQILAAMGERERKVFDAIPMDRPVTIDELSGLNYSSGQILASLSLLEIKGLIQTLPGGLYSRA